MAIAFTNELDRWIDALHAPIRQVRDLKAAAQDAGNAALEAKCEAELRTLRNLRARLTEMALASLGESDRLTEIVEKLKAERKTLRDAIDDGVDTAEELEKAAKTVETATALFQQVKDIIDS